MQTPTCRLQPTPLRRFREWKALALWRRAVSGRRAASSGAALERRLFGLNPALRRALMHVRWAPGSF